MWPNMEIDMMMGKMDAIRDIIRIATGGRQNGAEGENRARLFATARDMLRELADALEQKTPDDPDDE